MFVRIDNFDMSIAKVDEWIKSIRAPNDTVLSPEDALKVLTKTNHLGHIKPILNNIKKNCDTPEKLAPYKEFMLSCVEGREMSPNALACLRDMADMLGEEYRNELEKANDKYKIYGVRDCEKCVYMIYGAEVDMLEGDGYKIYFGNIDADLTGKDFSNVKEIKFIEGADVNLIRATGLHGKLDFSQCSKVYLSCCNLAEVDEIKFREKSRVCLKYAENLPNNLDLSMCESVDMMCCILEDCIIKFKDREQEKDFIRGIQRGKHVPIYEDEDNNMGVSLVRDDCMDL